MLPQAPGLLANKVSDPPAAAAATRPVLFTVAVVRAEESHLAVEVRFLVEVSE